MMGFGKRVMMGFGKTRKKGRVLPLPRSYFFPKYVRSGGAWSLRAGISLPSALR
jgi:hypothetical protein